MAPMDSLEAFGPGRKQELVSRFYQPEILDETLAIKDKIFEGRAIERFTLVFWSIVIS